MLTYDVVIIGSGIAGMTAAIYLKRAGISVVVIEGDTPGGQMNKSFIIENYPGYNNISGPDLAYNIYKQVKELNVDYIFDKVINIDVKDNTVIFNDSKVKYKYLIIASGRSPKKLDITNNRNINRISYCALCDGNLYKNKDVAVLGGGNSALEDSLYLSKVANKVTIILRKDKFRGEDKLIQNVLESPKIDILYETNIKSVKELDDKLELELSNNKTLIVSGLFICIGYIPNSDMYNLTTDNNYIVVDSSMKTSVDNIYACGDIIKKEVYQLTTASGEATVAASEIVKKLNKK